MREVAAGAVEVIFVDQEALIPKRVSHFRDICHFTGRGSRLFVDNLLRALEAPALGPGSGPPIQQ